MIPIVSASLGRQNDEKKVMSTYTPVTVGQMECGRKIANEKQIGRVSFQRALDNGSFSRFLDSLKVDSTPIKPPPGARIRIVHVKVKLDRPWQEAVTAAGPNTSSKCGVREMDDLYLPSGTGRIKRELIMLNYQQEGYDGWNKLLDWAEAQGLQDTAPREVFAIGEQHPKLHEQFGVNSLRVVATECSSEVNPKACYVWWLNARRRVCRDYLDHFGNEFDWFVFRK